MKPGLSAAPDAGVSRRRFWLLVTLVWAASFALTTTGMFYGLPAKDTPITRTVFWFPIPLLTLPALHMINGELIALTLALSQFQIMAAAATYFLRRVSPGKVFSILLIFHLVAVVLCAAVMAALDFIEA